MAAGLCYGVRGGGAQLAFHITPGNYDTDTLIEVLGELRRFLRTPNTMRVRGSAGRSGSRRA
jgi:hypothetical protein